MNNPSSRLKFSSAILILIVLGMASLRFVLLTHSEVSPIEADIAAQLIKDIQSQKTLHWKLIATHDPYQGSNFLRTDPKNSIQLRLDIDGTFREVRKDKIVNGRWKLNKGSNMLKMLCERINGSAVKRAHALSSYTLRSYNSEFLVLGKQGRHGIVELKFKAMSSTQRSASPDFF